MSEPTLSDILDVLTKLENRMDRLEGLMENSVGLNRFDESDHLQTQHLNDLGQALSHLKQQVGALSQQLHSLRRPR